MSKVIPTQISFINQRWKWIGFPFAFSILILIIGCGSGAKMPQDIAQTPLPKSLPSMGHTIQVGAFSNLNNAVRLTQRLQNEGLEAYHFRSQAGLYKVRVGNYRTAGTARSNAEKLKSTGIIDKYFLIGPTRSANTIRGADNTENLRKEIVRTANRFIGVPYRWGGQSPGTGFDCSGLTMVVYRLNGLNLPRSSRQQWNSGRPVYPGQLSKGDLVFFATSGGRRVSHVGIYIGNNKFLHAPSAGQKIRISSMSDKYYKTRYLGARTYL